MTLAPHFLEQVKEFFDYASQLHKENQNDQTFSYIAVKRDSYFFLIKGAVVYNTRLSKTPLTHFQSDRVRSGTYTLSELRLDPRGLIEALISGELSTPHGVLRFHPNDAGNYAATRDPFHQDGIKAQARLDFLTVLGGPLENLLAEKASLDWELRASPTPYDNLEELAFQYSVGPLRTTACAEVLCLNVAVFDFGSTLSRSEAKLAVLLAKGLSRQQLTLGYRLFDQGRVRLRSAIKGSEMAWTETIEHQRGETAIDIPNAAVLQCFVSYGGIAQHFGWVSDPSSAQNPKRAVYELFDQQLGILKEFLSKSGGKNRDARDLETAIAWLFWMLGFSVAHLGSTGRTQDAADLIVTTPIGHFAVVECTTGLLKTDQKLPLLVSRAEQVRQGIAASNNQHLRVLPVIVSSRPRAELAADMEQAEKLGILVLSREDIEAAVDRTLVQPNPEQIYDEAITKIEAEKAKYSEG